MYALTYRPAQRVITAEGFTTYVSWPTVVLSGLTYDDAHAALCYAYGLEGWAINGASIVPMCGAA